MNVVHVQMVTTGGLFRTDELHLDGRSQEVHQEKTVHRRTKRDDCHCVTASMMAPNVMLSADQE